MTAAPISELRLMSAPFDLTYEAPLGPVPDWLSYRISPTTTQVLPFTRDTLDANGEQTAVTGQATVTRYETEILQLPVTVSLPEGEERISLGADFTTAGGNGPTIARVYGETNLVTLGVSTPTITSPVGTTTAATATASLTSLVSAQASLASALTSASLLSQSSLVSSLSSDLSSISSAANSISSFLDPSSSSSTTSPAPSSASSSSSTPALSTDRLNSLAPSQLAAAIAAPICFFFLLVLLSLLCCFCIRRRRERRQDDNLFEGGGLAGGGMEEGNGSSWGERRREDSGDWDWVEPRMVAGSRMGGYFTTSSSNGTGSGSRTGTPYSRTGGRGGGETGEISLLAGGGRLSRESPRDDGQEDDEEDEEEDGEIGTVMMRGKGRAQATALGLGIASSTNRHGPSLPERAAATLNAGLRRISGGRLGGSPGGSSAEGYEYEPASTMDPHQEMVEHPTTTRPTYWDPYKPSPTTPQFPILAPVISATSDESSPPQPDGEFSPGTNTTSPDCEDIRRANLGLADLTNDYRGSPRTDETGTYDDHDEEHEEVDQESTEMLASSREDAAPRTGVMVEEEGNWLRNGRPKLAPPVSLPPLLRRPPSDLSISQYSQSDVGGFNNQPQRPSDQGSSAWLAAPAQLNTRSRSRENSGGSVASELSMGSLGSLGGNEANEKLFFTAPRWVGSRNPNTFPTSTISPVIPSDLMSGHLTPPPSSPSSSSSRYADAPIAPRPASTTTRTTSFHTPRLGGAESPSFRSRQDSGGTTTSIIEDSPMVYSVPKTRTRTTSSGNPAATRERRDRFKFDRPDSQDVLESAAKSYERERQGSAASSGGGGRGREKSGRKMIEDEWSDIRFVGDKEESKGFKRSHDAPFSNLTPLSSPLLPSPPTPPPGPTSRKSSSSLKDRQQYQVRH
ncbi:uncharacterized protein JCM6883_006385 [Sporobolomyces salmoneus]|uniref:uncharacterized protein n=1 Tax=Sporobolomyces salmoneus TaxID=183962 RepID=UPI003172FA29